jgi:hypothetical protein
VGGVTASAALIVILRLAVAVWGVGVAESVAFTVKLEVPAVVGEPEMMPAPLNVNPAGRLPEVTVQEYGAVPFDAVKVVDGYTELALAEPAGNEDDVTANVAAFLLVEQPATNRRAISAEIPKTRLHTPPRLTRKLLNISAILFG